MFGRTRFRLLKDDFFNIQPTIGDDNDSSLASLTVILFESLLDASTSEASEAQSRKGRTSAEKRTNKQTGEKLSGTQSPPKDGEAGKVPRRTTDSHTSTVAEDMADIKEQLKELTGSLALIKPVVAEIKSAYDNYNQSFYSRQRWGQWK